MREESASTERSDPRTSLPRIRILVSLMQENVRILDKVGSVPIPLAAPAMRGAYWLRLHGRAGRGAAATSQGTATSFHASQTTVAARVPDRDDDTPMNHFASRGANDSLVKFARITGIWEAREGPRGADAARRLLALSSHVSGL
ncbi:hypothetical protein KM043_001819 [Ampulex compressa]|nr:hypothetical protein KM043_001819 [Ampulex compressa]